MSGEGEEPSCGNNYRLRFGITLCKPGGARGALNLEPGIAGKPSGLARLFVSHPPIDSASRRCVRFILEA